jgi:phosphatidylserine/phosphatidylglycerophosphate/cardiolipin synthase-like enzyme
MFQINRVIHGEQHDERILPLKFYMHRVTAPHCSKDVLKRVMRTAAYSVALLFLVSCSSFSQSRDNIALSPGAHFAIGFSPNGSAFEIIVNGIRQAEKSILVAAYSFSSKPIATALLEAHNRGVRVQVIADKKSNTGKYSAATFLANKGVPVRVNGNYRIFHHKFMVIDGLHVETGSFNYSASAVSKNAENVLMIRNLEEIAEIYTRQWNLLWEESEPVQPNY